MYDTKIINNMIANQSYDSAYMKLLNKGKITFDSKFSDNGTRKRIIGGTYRHYCWSATFIENDLKEVDFYQNTEKTKNYKYIID